MKFWNENKEFYKKVFTLALPIACQSLITIGVNMLDTIMVGSLGDTALSATSLANSFILVYQILCMGLGMGAAVLVSRYWGMKNSPDGSKDEATLALRQTVCLMLRLTVALALLFALATALIPNLIMRMYTDDGAIIELGMQYLKYSVVTFLFLGTSLTSTIALRSVGQVRLPLLCSIGAFFVNLGANYVLIFGKLGFPELGVAGAALGTLIARIFETTIILGFLFLKDRAIGFRFKHIFIKTGSLLREYIRISIPVLISDGILAIGNNSVAMVIGRLGAEFVAANAITSVTQQLSTVMISGVSQAGAIVTGHTLGQNQKEAAMKQGYLFMGLGIALGTLSAIFVLLVKGPIISGYQNVSAQTSEIAHQLMLSISVILVFQATNSIMTKGVMRGGGDTRMLMLADNIFLWALSIPLGILAGFVFGWSPFWIYFCLKADQVAKTIWCIIRIRSGKWIKKIGTGAPTNQN